MSAPPPTPHLPETPRDALGPTVEEQVIFEDRTFLITRPDEKGDLLDHPAIRAAFAVDEYMPYWVDLWPASRMLAKVILKATWPPGQRCLEVGCGLGLPGIAALAAGMHVIFSDYDATALRFAADNARLNGFSDFELLQLDWRCPPAGLQVPVVLASDVLYEQRSVAPLVALIKHVLEPGGVCLLTDLERVPGHLLRNRLEADGMAYTTQVVRAGEPGGRRFRGCLYRITQSPAV